MFQSESDGAETLKFYGGGNSAGASLESYSGFMRRTSARRRGHAVPDLMKYNTHRVLRAGGELSRARGEGVLTSRLHDANNKDYYKERYTICDVSAGM